MGFLSLGIIFFVNSYLLSSNKSPMSKQFCFIFLLIATFSFGQDSNWDTLSPELATYKKQDTIRLQLLLDATRYYEVRNLKDSDTLFKEAEKIAAQLNIPKFNGRLLLTQSRYKLLEGIYNLATDKLLLAIPLLEESNDQYYLREAAIIQAEIDRENDNFLKAVRDLKTAVLEVDMPEDKFQLAELYLHLGIVYMNINNDETYKKAIPQLKKAKKLFIEIGSKTGVGLTNIRLARFYKIESLKTGKQINHEIAMNFARDATELFKEKQQTANEAYGYYTMGTSKSIIGDHEASIPYYKNSLKKYEEAGNLIFAMRVNQHLFVAYSITKQQDKAKQSNAQFVKIKDSIFSIEKRQLIADAQTRFETAKVKADKEKAEIREERNLYYFIGSAMIGVLISLVSLFFFRNLKHRRKTEIISLELQETQKRLALEKQYRDSELKALKAQMNPHFIFNALNSIQEYIILNQKNLASEYLGKFADLMRKYLYYSDAGGISIEDEVRCLKMYLELEELRFEDKLTYSINVSEDIKQEDTIIPTMLIQPYVENALKHGLLHRKTNRKLSVKFKMANTNTIHCIIEDNGIGRAASSLKRKKRKEDHQSFASKATANRLSLLNHGKEQQIGVLYTDLTNDDDTPKGTRVQLTIPLIKKE
ncbi:possible sensor protein [unidentified eubacterium SCB49]|nr:possible sensor protein [unidentified eubacterium SCB49]